MSLKSYSLCTHACNSLLSRRKYHAGSTEINILNTVALHDLKLAFGC